MVYREAALAVCPSCGMGLLRMSVRGFELARCESCQGVWVDERTLAELWRFMGMPPQLLALAPAIQERPRPCPSCRQNMRYVHLLTVKLDHCPACGVWFDGQELEAAMAFPDSKSERDWLAMFASELSRGEPA